MGAFYETIPKSLMQWILQQKVFWVATAPLSGRGHVNVSPKGGQYYGLIDEKTFWYQDLTGSGNETISHLHEPGNGRVTIMFNAFESAPKIVRLWGYGKPKYRSLSTHAGTDRRHIRTGRVLENPTKPFTDFVAEHKVDTIPGTRSIIIVDIHQVGSSCGFSVPFYDFKEFRPTLNDYMANKKKKYEEGREEENMDQ